MSTDDIKSGVEAIKSGKIEDDRGNYDEALNLYEQGIAQFIECLNSRQVSEKTKDILRTKCDQYLERAELLQDYLNDQERKVGEKSKRGPTVDGGDPEKLKLFHQFDGVIMTESPQVRWSDVAGLENAKRVFKQTVILPSKFPKFFTGKRSPWKGILLFGPPGTGKTRIVRAVATEARATSFYAVSSADLLSKWVGESEKLIKALFEHARRHKPSIIFIDEIDSICSSRTDSDADHARRIKNEFLLQMEGSGSTSDGVLVVGATNMPWVLDPAVRRRFEKRLYIPLPDEDARYLMFKLHVGDTTNNLTDDNFRQLARETQGFCGADISIVVRDALMEPMRRLQEATHFAYVRKPPEGNTNQANNLLMPCAQNHPGAIKISADEVPEEKLYEEPVTMNDMLISLKRARPTVGVEDLLKLEDFRDNFGKKV